MPRDLRAVAAALERMQLTSGRPGADATVLKLT